MLLINKSVNPKEYDGLLSKLKIRKVVCEDEKIPNMFYILGYSDEEWNQGVYYIVPAAILFKLAVIASSYWNIYRNKPSRVQKWLEQAYNLGFVQGHAAKKQDIQKLKDLSNAKKHPELNKPISLQEKLSLFKKAVELGEINPKVMKKRK